VKAGDLVAYAWNAKERPEDIEIAIVVQTNVPGPGPNEWVRISIQREPVLNRPLIVPRFKLDVIS
jgi:hypothetical protein